MIYSGPFFINFWIFQKFVCVKSFSFKLQTTCAFSLQPELLLRCHRERTDKRQQLRYLP